MKELSEAKNTISGLLDSQKKQIMAALPKHLTADRMLRICLTEFRKNPKLMQCDPKSLLGSVIQCSQLGLEPGSTLGHAYLIPYGTQCQFMIGYRGMLDLVRRSDKLLSLSAHVVHANDEFRFEYGLKENLIHVPTLEEEGEIVAVYGVARLKDGSHQIEVMSKRDVDKIRARSKSGRSGPWVTDYEEMARKTVIRRLFKYLPVSIEIQKAVNLDEQAERGDQRNELVIEPEEVMAIEEPKTQSEEILKELQNKDD